MEKLSEVAQLDGESTQAYAAFVAYLRQGPGRTLIATALSLNRPRSYRRQLSRWAKKYAWSERARAFDVGELAEESKSRVELREEALEKLYSQGPRAAEICINVMEGKQVPGAKANLQLAAADGILQKIGLTPPRRYELDDRAGQRLAGARAAAKLLTVDDLRGLLEIVRERRARGE